MRARRLIRDLSEVLIIAGLLLLLDAGATLVWQEPVTAAIGYVERAGVDTHLEAYGRASLSGLDRHALGSLTRVADRVAFLARRERRQVHTNQAIGRIEIAKIGVHFDVVEGTDSASLRKGPGHYSSTALPGLARTVAIAGHRTTYLAPFRRVNELRPGDPIVVRMPYARFTYVVQMVKVVLPTALYVTADVGYDRLVLSACHPLYSASHRIIVFARLRDLVPTANPGA